MSRALPDIPVPELSALVRAVRGGASTARSHKDLRAAAAAFLVILATSLHSAGAAAWNSREAHSRAPHEESKMKFSARGVMVASALAVSSGAVAQNAVQWRVQDGGNGHWYQVAGPQPDLTWPQALSLANTVGGHPVTFAGTSESAFVVAIVQSSVATLCPLGPWIGLVQYRTDPSYSEPAGGWRWIDGTNAAIDWQQPINPNNDCFGVAEDFANMTFDGKINDLAEDPSCTGPWPNGAINSVVIEWSADCNNDGIVDYGQIRAGELTDTNGNNIPDCCEQGISCDTTASGPEAYLQFEGNCLDSSGNGRNGLANAISYAKGSPAVSGLAASFDGLTSDVRIEGVPIPTNNQFSWSLWFRTETIGNIALIERIESIGNNLLSPSLFIRVDGGLGFGSYSFGSGGTSVETGPSVVSVGSWIHVVCTSAASGLRRLYVNGQLVGENYSLEYGQPLALMLLGRDRLDCCPRFQGMMDELRIYSRALSPAEVVDLFQPPCPGDVDNSGSVNGVDLAAVLNNWGTNGGKYPGADTNHDGIVDGVDLAQVLGGWGPCH